MTPSSSPSSGAADRRYPGPHRQPRPPAELASCGSYRHLVRTLVERDLRVRYKNSVLGIAWTMVSPLIQVFVLTIAIGYILGSGPKNLSAYIFCATIPWTFFQTAILDSSTSVLAKLGLLKKVYFPREIPLIATVCQNFVQFLISLGIFMVYRWVLTPLLFGWPWPAAAGDFLAAGADRRPVSADPRRGVLCRHGQRVLRRRQVYHLADDGLFVLSAADHLFRRKCLLLAAHSPPVSKLVGVSPVSGRTRWPG